MLIFIISGQSRTSPFSHLNRNMSILDSYNKYIFTDELKKHMIIKYI